MHQVHYFSKAAFLEKKKNLNVELFMYVSVIYLKHAIIQNQAVIFKLYMNSIAKIQVQYNFK